MLHALVEGQSNKEIAATRECTERTVEAHLTALIDKAGASSRLEVVSRFWLGHIERNCGFPQ